MIAEVDKRLHNYKKKLDFGLYVVNSVQEEIGLRGAQMIAERIDPDVAIITDVTHDTNSPMYDKKKSGDIKSGKGPALSFGPAVQNNLLKLLIDSISIPEEYIYFCKSLLGLDDLNLLSKINKFYFYGNL